MRIITLTAFLLLSLGMGVRASTIVVGSAEEFKSALTETGVADTILLEPGFYAGQFVVSSPGVIIGTAGVVIDGEGVTDVLIVSADSVVLQKLTVQNSGTRLLKDHAGIKVTGSHVEIAGCTIRDNLHGIYVKAGNYINIRDNTIRGRDNIQESDRGNGIHLWNTTGNVVINNDISGARDGIYFSFADRTEVVNNRIHHLRYGLHYMYSDENSFEGNLFTYNVAGSALMYSKQISFKGNVFAHSRGLRAYGILLQSVEHCTAENNLILDNTKAVFLDDANYNRFVSNDIVQNDLAVQINASCDDNIIAHNNFLSNLSEVSMDGSVMSTTEWQVDGTGNFWSAYEGWDLDGNGVGDIPYQLQSVFEYMEMNDPAVRFYLHSPASHLLAVAEKRLPILRKSVREDKLPLFRPANNEAVPWQMLEGQEAGSSAVHLAFWSLAILVPAGLMWRMRA